MHLLRDAAVINKSNINALL